MAVETAKGVCLVDLLVQVFLASPVWVVGLVSLVVFQSVVALAPLVPVAFRLVGPALVVLAVRVVVPAVAVTVVPVSSGGLGVGRCVVVGVLVGPLLPAAFAAGGTRRERQEGAWRGK